EFNGYKGFLISMALVREDGEAKYWVLSNTYDFPIIDPWVMDNVVPHLLKGPYELISGQEDLSREIARFMKHDDNITVIADWPDDIKYFCDVIVFGPGKCRNLKKVHFEFDRAYG